MDTNNTEETTCKVEETGCCCEEAVSTECAEAPATECCAEVACCEETVGNETTTQCVSTEAPVACATAQALAPKVVTTGCAKSTE